MLRGEFAWVHTCLVFFRPINLYIEDPTQYPSIPEDDAARNVAHVQAAGHLFEVVLPRNVALVVQLPILLQPG